MSQTDLIGWGSLLLFAIFFAVLYRFITSPGKGLEKTLGDGRALGLRKLRSDSPQFHRLANLLRPRLGTHGHSFRLGGVYENGRGNGYLFSLVEIRKVDRAGGTATEHQHQEKGFWMAPSRLSGSFVIRPRPRHGLGGDLAVSLLSERGYGLKTVEAGLVPEFLGAFVVYGDAKGSAGPSEGLQRAFLEAAVPSGSGSAVIEQVEGVAFAPDSFLIHLSAGLRSRSVEQLRQILEFAGRIEQEIAP
jgi:hypothetical protein